MEIGNWQKKKKKVEDLTRLVFLGVLGLEEFSDSGSCPESGGLDRSLIKVLFWGELSFVRLVFLSLLGWWNWFKVRLVSW